MRIVSFFTTLSLVLAALAGFTLTTPLHAQSAPASQPAAPELRVFDPSLIDKTVDPCDNFYKFSCNGWFKKNPLPADQASYGRFTELHELNQKHLREILEASSQPNASRTPNEQKVGDEYASCMDTATLNKVGFTSLQPELDRIAALKSADELPALLGHLHAIGVRAFFSFSADQDFANANDVILAFGASGLGLPERDFYFRTDAKSAEIRQKYLDHIQKMLVFAGESAADAKKDADLILALETRLAKASLTITEERDPQNLNHPSDVTKLTAELNHFALPTYLTAAGAPTSGKLNNSQPKFLAEFNTLVSDTKLADIKIYLRWQLLHAYAGTSTPEAVQQENWNFYSHILHGAEKQQDRWKLCTARVDHEIGEALGQVYVAKYFPPETKQRALDMTIAIEKAMDKDLDTLDWMSPETKAQARIKLHAVLNKIGYPDKWRDYSKLTIVRGDALGNQLRVRQFNFARDMAKIGKPVDKLEWYMSPPTVNAYYEPQQNNVNFPAGYFQPPFFSALEDDAANYGDMGSTVGHELTHGFDDEGHQFDGAGNLKDWWTKDDAKKFDERTDCLVKQYDAIEAVPGVHLNGKLTLGENLADLGGLWLAWIAWLDIAHDQHIDMNSTMDGYTPDQRFWIAYAQQWCTQTRPEQLRTQAQTDPHSPDEYRTNAVLADLPEFAKSFKCTKPSAVVNPKPCRVW
jgi:endothelin-converting enzyme/putative endopeptidase